MTTYDVFVVLDSTLEQAERIYDHVDDATVASISGTVTVDFGRDAETLDDAIASALRDVRKAGCEPAEVSAR